MATTSAHSSPPLTDTDIIQLAQKHPNSSSQSTAAPPLPPFLLSESSHQTLLSYLHSRATTSPNPSSAVSEYTSAVISLTSLHPSLSSLLSSLLLSYASLFTAHKIPHDRLSLSTIQLFTAHLDSVPVSSLPPIIDSITSYIPKITDSEDTQMLILLLKCLELIRTSNEFGNAYGYINSVFDSLIKFEWSKVLLVKMVEIIREFSFMQKEKRRDFLGKVFNGMKDVDLQDLPGLVYQLLVLASKGFSKKEVIEGIVMYFGDKMQGKKKGGSIVKQVEGTVLLHVNFAVKQDPSLGQEVLGLVKADSRAINHFTVAVLLSVARVRRFCESSIGVLKTALLSAYTDYKFVKECKWLSDDLKEAYLQIARVMEQAIIKAVNESDSGREHIIPSIVQFGFALLEGVEEGSKRTLENSDGLLGGEQLGSQMLKSSFEVHDMARKEIIEQCKFRILSLKPQQAFPITRLLEHLIKSHPYQMLDHLPHLKELLDYFTFTHAEISSRLVFVLLPLTKFSHDLQDYSILVLRKAMFRREESVRVAATNSIINLILAEMQRKKDDSFSFQESSSQASCSQQADVPCIPGAGLFMELSGLLQRCLYQQAKVREMLYHGLVKLVLVDPLAAGSVFDFLLPHFLRYYKEDADIKLDIFSCIKSENGKFHVQEPFDSLLSCISWILLLQPQDKTGHHPDSWASFGFSLTQENEAGRILSGESFANALSKIRKFLTTASLEGLLGKTDDTDSTIAEEKNRCCASILLGISEVVLNIIINELEKANSVKKVELQNELLEFVVIHDSLEKFTGFTRQVSGPRRGTVRSTASDTIDKLNSGGSTSPQERVPILATSSICWLLELATELLQIDFSNSSTPSEKHSQVSSSNVSHKHSKLISFVLNACLSQLTSLSFVGREDPLKMLIYGEPKLLGPPLLKLIRLLQSVVQSHKKKQTRGCNVDGRNEHIHLALVCLQKLMTVSLCSSHIDELIEALVSASEVMHGPSDTPHSDRTNECELAEGLDDETTRSKEIFIRNSMIPLLMELLASSSFSEVEIVCDMLMMVGNQLPAERRNIVGARMLHICKNSDLQNPKLARSLVSLVVSLSLPPSDLTVSQEMACELLKVVGSFKNKPADSSESKPADSSESKPVDSSEIFRVINKTTCAAIASSTLQLVESIIVDMDWTITKLRTYSTATQKGVCLDPHRKVGPGLVLQETLYSRVEAIVKVLSYYVLMHLKDPQAEEFLRLAAKLYKDLARMAKLLIASRGCKQVLPSLKYQKLVEITCRELTAPLYKFMEQLQKDQQESINNKGLANKIKRENKCIPELIFQIEDYEKYLIQLSKATKVNLLRHAKRSTSRDFKILDSNDIVMGKEGDGRSNGTDNNEGNNNAENESSEASGDAEEGNGEAHNVLSPESDVQEVAEASGSGGEDEAGVSNGQDSKRRRVVEESSSDEEMVETGQSLAF